VLAYLELNVFLLVPKNLPLSSPYLLSNQVHTGHHLCHRVLNLCHKLVVCCLHNIMLLAALDMHCISRGHAPCVCGQAMLQSSS